MFQFNTAFIKRRLDEINMSQITLSMQLGIDPSKTSRIITNKHKSISLELLWEMCQILNIQLSDLVVHDEPVTKTATELLDETRRYLTKLDEAFSLYYTYKKINNHDNFTVITDKDCGETHISEEDMEEAAKLWIDDMD